MMTRETPILLVGYNVRAMALSARLAGFTTWAFDYFGDRDRGPGYDLKSAGIVEFDARLLVTHVMAHPPSRVIWGSGFENQPALLDILSLRHVLWGNSRESVERVRTWNIVCNIANTMGISCPRQQVSGVVPRNGRWLLKPKLSGGGKGIRQAGPGEMIRHGMVAQKWLEGESVSLTFLSDGKRLLARLWTKAFKDPTGPSFRYTGGVLCPYGIGRDAGGEAMALALVRQCGLRGWNGIDFVYHKGQLTYLEVNPRWTGSVELWERATGYPAIGALSSAMDGSTMAFPAPEKFVGKRIVYARTPTVWNPEIEDALAGSIADIPRSGEQFLSEQPICTVFAEGLSFEDVSNKLQRMANHVLQSCEHMT